MSTTHKDRLRELLEPVAGAAGVDLEDLSVSPAGKRRLLRVVVDRDGGLDMDAVAEVSRAISQVLDDSDTMGSTPYQLEVTTPGVDRPLTLPRHWRRAEGRLVKVRRTEGGPVTGRVVEADDEGADLEADGNAVRVAYADVVSAVVQIEFNRKGAAGDENDGLDEDQESDDVEDIDEDEEA